MLGQLGDLRLHQNKSLLRQLDDVREKVNRTSQLSAKYSQRLAELQKLNKTLAAGYVNNLNVIVDVSKALAEYRNTMAEVLRALGRMDEDMLGGLSGADVESIKQLTSDKLQRVSEFFQQDVKKVRDALTALGSTEALTRLAQTEQNFQATLQQSRDSYAVLARQAGGRGRGAATCGCARRRGRGRGRASRPLV